MYIENIKCVITLKMTTVLFLNLPKMLGLKSVKAVLVVLRSINVCLRISEELDTLLAPFVHISVYVIIIFNITVCLCLKIFFFLIFITNSTDLGHYQGYTHLSDSTLCKICAVLRAEVPVAKNPGAHCVAMETSQWAILRKFVMSITTVKRFSSTQKKYSEIFHYL